MINFLNSIGITSFLVAIIGGCLIGLPTGPARFFVVDTFLNEGKTAALRVYGGLFSAVLIYSGLAVLADDLILQNKDIESTSYFIASLLLAFWGGLIIVKSKNENDSSIKLNFGSFFIKGFITGLSNPIIPFVYLAFIQILKIYSNNPSLFQKGFFILIFEIFSFLTTSGLALTLMKKRKSVLESWRTIKIVMGILLICLGTFNSFQQLDFSDGIKIKRQNSLMEEKTKNLNK